MKISLLSTFKQNNWNLLEALPYFKGLSSVECSCDMAHMKISVFDHYQNGAIVIK